MLILYCLVSYVCQHVKFRFRIPWYDRDHSLTLASKGTSSQQNHSIIKTQVPTDKNSSTTLEYSRIARYQKVSPIKYIANKTKCYEALSI